MTRRDKTEKQKDIDDVLSSIDSLLDTATDVEVDDLPVLEIEPESKTVEVEEKTETPTALKNHTADKKKIARKVPARSTRVPNRKPPTKKDTRISVAKNSEEKQPVTEKLTETKQPEIKAATNVEKKTQPPVEKKTAPNPKETERPERPKSTLNFSTIQTDFSLTQKELPVLDEIITDQEMALIAAGKELPKRVITEKFVPKTTTDKIIDVVAIQLADYNITRLEYEYLHELIDEILEEDKKS